MALSLIIIVLSGALFGYWFRYTCLLILNSSTHRDYAREVAQENRLHFPSIPVVLRDVPDQELARIAESLREDYAVVMFLLKQMTQLRLGSISLEQYLVAADFLVMSAWYSAVSSWLPESARVAVGEMRNVVAHMTNGYGEQVARNSSISG